MNNTFLIYSLIFSSALIACHSNQQQQADLETIKEKEELVFSGETIQNNPKDQQELLILYKEYTDKYTLDTNQLNHARKSLLIYTRNNSIEDKVRLYQRWADQDDFPEMKILSSLKLAEHSIREEQYKRAENYIASLTVEQNGKDANELVLYKQIIKAAQDNSGRNEKLHAIIKVVEDNVYGEMQAKLTRDNAQLLANYYAQFGTEFPTDPKTANYLFKAADLQRYLKNHAKAVGLYGQVYAHYPSFKKRPHALFLQAFTFENDMGNAELAKEKYETFVKEFPDHDLADDAQFSLDNLGLTPDEIIKKFENSK